MVTPVEHALAGMDSDQARMGNHVHLEVGIKEFLHVIALVGTRAATAPKTPQNPAGLCVGWALCPRG